MKLRAILYTIIALAAGLLAIGFMLVQGIKNARGCERYVIDSNELIIHMDIPAPQKGAMCYDDSIARVGIYHIADVAAYQARFAFEDAPDSTLRWTQSMLEANEAPLPKGGSVLKMRSGNSTRGAWQVTLDSLSGQMWVEVLWTSEEN